MCSANSVLCEYALLGPPPPPFPDGLTGYTQGLRLAKFVVQQPFVSKSSPAECVSASPPHCSLILHVPVTVWREASAMADTSSSTGRSVSTSSLADAGPGYGRAGVMGGKRGQPDEVCYAAALAAASAAISNLPRRLVSPSTGRPKAEAIRLWRHHEPGTGSGCAEAAAKGAVLSLPVGSSCRPERFRILRPVDGRPPLATVYQAVCESPWWAPAVSRCRAVNNTS